MCIEYLKTIEKVLKLINDKGYSVKELQININNNKIYIDKIKIEYSDDYYFKFYTIICNNEIKLTDACIFEKGNLDIGITYNKETRKIGKAILELFDYIEKNF